MPRIKVTSEVKEEIGHLRALGLTQQDIADELGLSQYSISVALRPEAKKHHNERGKELYRDKDHSERWHVKNKERHRSNQLEHYYQNREKKKAAMKVYYAANKSKWIEYWKKYPTPS
jgi:transcriptional regulator with XRE-family HTH domain